MVRGVKLKVARSPKVPTFCPFVCRTQGITAILDQPQNRTFAKRGHDVEIEGIPQGMRKHTMALVFGVIAASILSASMLWVRKSTSTNTGTAPNCKMGSPSLENLAATQ